MAKQIVMENNHNGGGDGRDFTRNHADREFHSETDNNRPMQESRAGDSGERGNTETGANYGHLQTNENPANEHYSAAPDKPDEDQNQSRH